MITEFFTWLLGLILSFFATVLDSIFSLFGGLNLPVFNDFSSILTSMWDFAFNILGYVRSALLLDTFEMGIIVDIITIRLLYKPAISVIKMFVGWFNKLKV